MKTILLLTLPIYQMFANVTMNDTLTNLQLHDSMADGLLSMAGMIITSICLYILKYKFGIGRNIKIDKTKYIWKRHVKDDENTAQKN
jgi:hypothetical protein